MAALLIPVAGTTDHGPGLAAATGPFAAVRCQVAVAGTPSRPRDAHVVAAGEGRWPAMDAAQGRGCGRQAGAAVRVALVGAAVEAARVVAPHLVEAGHGRALEAPVGAVRRRRTAPGPLVEGVTVQGRLPTDAPGEATCVAVAPGVGGAAGGAAPVVAVRAP